MAAAADATVRRRWNAATLVATGLYVLSLAAFCAAAASPRFVGSIGLGAYANGRAWWPILVQVVLALAAFGCFYWPRRRENRSFAVLVSAGLAATTLALGLFSYLNCPESANQSVFWAPLTWSINLVGGNVRACGAGGYPLALQLARLSGPLLVVVAGLGIAVAVSRNQYDRIIVRYARSLVLLVGLGEAAVPLLRRLADEPDRGATLVVIVASPTEPLVKVARDLGARVVSLDPANTDALSSLLTARGRFKVRAFYAASDDPAVNLRWAEQLRSIADASRRSTDDRPPRMVVRIDDPWQAEYWRRTNAYRTEGDGGSMQWASDALSVYEVTAALLLDRVLLRPSGPAYDRLVIVGNSPLTLALCADLAQRERESKQLEQPLVLDFADVLLLGAEAELLREQHRLRQARFGNDVAADLIAVDVVEATPDHLQAALADARRPAVIVADGPSAASIGRSTYLAALKPEWTIFSWGPGVRGVPSTPIMEQLYVFGLTTEAPRSLPVDSWERAARVVHERFLLDLTQDGALDPTKGSNRHWDDGLHPFFKESNVRQVTTVLAAAEARGRSWGPLQREVSAEGLVGSVSLAPDDLDAMARTEHSSWMRYLTDRGWRYGLQRRDDERIHPSLRDWDQLSEVDKSKTRDGVANALHVLEALGYRSSTLREVREPMTPTWSTVARRGEITAERLTQHWSWENERGDTMRAEAGDWRVTNDEGTTWSVAPDVFEQTYVAVGGDRWRRTGELEARPAAPGEVITSLEGRQTAVRGDWVIRGSQGEMWLTSAEHFAASYALLTD